MRVGQVLVVTAGLLLFAAMVPSTIASAQPIYYPNDGYDWNTEPDDNKTTPSAKCIGNCGADCSGAKNPCGGDHYWELEIVSPVNLVTALEEEECKPDSVGMPGDVPGTTRRRSGGLYRASGRWNFHGVYANICAEHDVACRTTSLPGPWYVQLVNPLYIGYCLVGGALSGALICLDSTMPYVWTYEEQIFGYKFGPWRSTGESCTVFGGSGI